MNDAMLTSSETSELVALAQKLVDRGSRAPVDANKSSPPKKPIDMFSPDAVAARLSSVEEKLESHAREMAFKISTLMFTIERQEARNQKIDGEVAAFRQVMDGLQKRLDADREAMTESASAFASTVMAEMSKTLDRIDGVLDDTVQAQAGLSAAVAAAAVEEDRAKSAIGNSLV